MVKKFGCVDKRCYFCIGFRGSPPAPWWVNWKPPSLKIAAKFNKINQNKMLKELRNGYQLADKTRGNAFSVGEEINNVTTSSKMKVAGVYSRKGACALYKVESTNKDEDGYYTSMDLKKIAGRELAARTGVCGTTRVRALKEEDVPTIYTSYTEKFTQLVEKINRLQSKYDLAAVEVEPTSEEDFTTIMAKKITESAAARKAAEKATKEKKAAEKLAAAFGLEASMLDASKLEAIQAILAGKEAKK